MANGLGRGLSSLIPPKSNQFNVSVQQKASTPEVQVSGSMQIQDIPVNHILPNSLQPRQHFDDKTIDELAESIDQYGLLEPVVVVKEKAGWQLIAGERRLRAFKKLKKKTIPGIVRTASELERLELAIIENVQRQDLNPIEKAQSYAKLVDEFGLTQVEAAKKIGIARSSLANAMRLLDLPAEVQIGLAAGKISEGHAKIILGLPSEKEQLEVYKQITSGKTGSVRELQQVVDQGGRISKRRSVIDYELQEVENILQEKLGTKVSIKKKSGGKFQIIIDAYSAEEFKGVVKKLR